VSAVSLSRAGRILAVAVAVVFTIGCDRVTKEAAARHLAGRPRLSMVKDAIRLEYVENRGGFLSLGADFPEALRIAVFALGPAVLLAVLGAWVCRRVVAGRSALGPALLWAGGVANLGDRIARGSVIDFLNLGVGTLRTGIFNVADVAIMAGALLIALELLASRPAESGLAPEGPPQG
jgi:signal peptidase II